MDKSQSALRVLLLAKVRWTFSHDHFQRWPHVRLCEMSSHCRPVPFSNDEMDVKRRFSRWGLRHVTDKRGNFDLLADRNPQVMLLFPIEIEKDQIAEGADSSHLGGKDALAGREPLQAPHDLIASLKNDSVGPLSTALVQTLVLHTDRSVKWLTMTLTARFRLIPEGRGTVFVGVR
jgi:hypothetical protein